MFQNSTLGQSYFTDEETEVPGGTEACLRRVLFPVYEWVPLGHSLI